MVFVTGPLYSGKKTFVKEWMHWDEETLSRNAVWDVQELVSDCEDRSSLNARRNWARLLPQVRWWRRLPLRS